VLNYHDKWNKCLLLADFSYNNNYQESLIMAPLNWIEPSERMIFGPDLVTEAEEIVHHIQTNLKATKAQQESYANKRHRPLEFEAGDHVYLCVSPTRGVKMCGIKGKLAPCYISMFPVLAKWGMWHTNWSCHHPW
jgi:hypothetical protein